jgi:uncharacterized protein (TIGR03435 family)
MNRLAVLVVSAVTTLSAQSDPPRFEVASIRRNVSGASRSSFRIAQDGTVSFVNLTLRDAVAQTYGFGSGLTNVDLAKYKLVGGREEIMSARFDITAKPPEESNTAAAREMLRTLLTERFRLRIRPETRPTPVYAVVRARSGALGPNLRSSTYDCAARFTAGENFNNAGPAALKVCWAQQDFDRMRAGIITDTYAGPITQLIRRLQGYLDRPLIDASGLSGSYQWTLTFASDPLDNRDVPSIFTASEEQLGLKLEARTEPFEVFVIDSVEMPTPD